MKKWFGVVILSLMIGVGIGTLLWNFLPQGKKNKLLSPVGLLNREDKKMEVVGFLPSWMIGKTKLYGGELTQLIFSGIEVNKDGSLIWDVQSKKINNDSFLAVKNSVKGAGGKNMISIKLFTDKSLDALVASEAARQNLYREVSSIVEAGKFDGVNVDFEYMSNATRILDDDMITMFREMKSSGWGEISVDVFANTIIKGEPEKIKRFSEVIDSLIVMAYDFHRPGSDMAGAVAPIDAEDPQKSIGAIFRKISEGSLDGSKLIMAYPLYGYEWETETDLLGSLTRTGSYGSTVFYNGGVGFTGVKWNEISQSPWVSWQEEAQRSRIVYKKVGKKYKKTTEYFTVNQWHQAYFEDEKSLQIKVNLAKENKVDGVGFWALGYEGKTDLINDLTKFL